MADLIIRKDFALEFMFSIIRTCHCPPANYRRRNMIRVSSLFKDGDNTRNKAVMVDSSWHKGLTNVGKDGSSPMHVDQVGYSSFLQVLFATALWMQEPRPCSTCYT